jgi:hypothetical protein
MKFFCEYCGNRIDAEKDHKCPNCGASYRKNPKFLKLEEERKKEQQVNNEYKHKVINHVLGTMKFSRFFMIIPILAFIIIFTIVILGILSVDKKTENNDNNFNVEEIFDSILEEPKEQEKIKANFNEFAETKKYKVKVEKYEVVEDKFNKAEPGYELVKFHLVVENITTNEIRSEDVNCIVDGVAQNNTMFAGYSELPMFISRELAVKGTATFIVPTDVTSYDIRYGDYVTIHIEK